MQVWISTLYPLALRAVLRLLQTFTELGINRVILLVLNSYAITHAATKSDAVDDDSGYAAHLDRFTGRCPGGYLCSLPDLFLSQTADLARRVLLCGSRFADYYAGCLLMQKYNISWPKLDKYSCKQFHCNRMILDVAANGCPVACGSYMVPMISYFAFTLGDYGMCKVRKIKIELRTRSEMLSVILGRYDSRLQMKSQVAPKTSFNHALLTEFNLVTLNRTVSEKIE